MVICAMKLTEFEIKETGSNSYPHRLLASWFWKINLSESCIPHWSNKDDNNSPLEEIKQDDMYKAFSIVFGT